MSNKLKAKPIKFISAIKQADFPLRWDRNYSKHITNATVGVIVIIAVSFATK